MKCLNTKHATLYLGKAEDCIANMPTIDLLCTDPPYGCNVRSMSTRKAKHFPAMLNDQGDYDPIPVLTQYVAKLREARHCYIFGNFDLSKIDKLNGQAQIVWAKLQLVAGNLTIPWSKDWEPIQFAVRIGSNANRKRGDGTLAAKLRRGSIIAVRRKNGLAVRRHPTEKPIQLLQQLIESSSVPGELVADPYAGVGSTAVASILAGRRFVGCELDPTYYQIACERITAAEAIKQQMEKL